MKVIYQIKVVLLWGGYDLYLTPHWIVIAHCYQMWQGSTSVPQGGGEGEVLLDSQRQACRELLVSLKSHVPHDKRAVLLMFRYSFNICKIGL